MKLIKYTHQDTNAEFGVLNDAGIIPLTGYLSELNKDINGILSDAGLSELNSWSKTQTPSLSVDDIEYEAFIPDAEKIICVGVNYANRNAEYKDNQDLPPYPSLFIRFPDSFTGHQQSILRPPESDKLDYEGEIVMIIGKGGRRIKEDNAYEHIAGLSLANEGTLRDWVRHAKFNVTQGKNFDNSGALGPCMLTKDEVAKNMSLDEIDYNQLIIQTRVNDELRQDDVTSNMMFPIAFQIAYISKFCTLKPGDVIITGTPTGAGARFTPPKYLVPGDVVEVSSPHIGTLTNTVADEVI